ncbi:MAG TPA: N4-gp56 family major capsid protein [Nocardioides sp.]|nr:N4-gp56 family major capsid protein [Nocardioides sp.]
MGTVISTSTTNFDKALVTLIQKNLEQELRAPLPHLLPGNFRKAEFVKGTNNTMRFLRIQDMAELAGEDADPSAGTAPWLTEGTPPTSEDLTLGYEEFSANQAGRVIKLTDKAMQAHPIDMLGEAAAKVARNALETADRRVARVLGAGSNVLYADLGSDRLNIGTNDVLSASVLRRAIAGLKADNVPAFPDGLYRAIINPAATFEFMEETGNAGWQNAALYAGSMPLLSGELGRFAGCRFIESSAAKVFADAGTTSKAIALTLTAATDVFAGTAHGLKAGDKVRFRTVATSATPAEDTVYYVIASGLTADAFKVSATAGGATINIDADGSVASGDWGVVNDVYSTFIYGPEAYVFGDWGTIEAHITPPGGHDDPLHQSALVGWKGYFGAMLVGEGDNATNASGPRYVRVESGSSL